MNGKEKCRILREIRKQIALENDIRLVTEECTFKGECRGTCPKCESEVRYLEQQLEKSHDEQERLVQEKAAAAETLQKMIAERDTLTKQLDAAVQAAQQAQLQVLHQHL